MGEQIIAHILPGDPGVERRARRYLAASRSKAQVWKSPNDLTLPWCVTLPGIPGVARFHTFASAIRFATKGRTTK